MPQVWPNASSTVHSTISENFAWHSAKGAESSASEAGRIRSDLTVIRESVDRVVEQSTQAGRIAAGTEEATRVAEENKAIAGAAEAEAGRLVLLTAP